MTKPSKHDVIFSVGTIYTQVLFSPDLSLYLRAKILEILANTMWGYPEGYRFMKKYKSGRWDGRISLFKRGKFPTGLLSLAIEQLDKVVDSLEISYRVEKLYIPPVDIHMITVEKVLRGKHDTLRPYQKHAVRELGKAKRGIAHMATNAGKTFVMAALVNVIGGRTLIIVHTKELLYQIADVMYEHANLKVGLIGDGHLDTDADLIIATIQTLHNMTKDSAMFSEFAAEIDVLLIDETHHASAKTVYEIVMKIPANYRFGFSGTPLKHQKLADMQLMAATGEIIVHVSNEELIEAGYSAIPQITMYKMNGNRNNLKYQQAYVELIVDNAARNGKIAEEAIEHAKDGKVVLILVNRIDHQQLIASTVLTLQDYKLGKIISVNGRHSTDTRRKVLDDMRAGHAGIYIATNIFGEGVDIPSVDTLIIGGAGKSHIRLLQQVGRGMRQKQGKDNTVTIIDFVDRGNRYLENHSKKRREVYENEGFAVEIVE